MIKKSSEALADISILGANFARDNNNLVWQLAERVPEQKVTDGLRSSPVVHHGGKVWRKTSDGYGYEYAAATQPDVPEESPSKKIYTRWKPSGYAVEALANAGIDDVSACWLLVKMASVAQDNAQFGGLCYTGSIEAIAALTNLSVRTIYRALPALIDADLLKVVKRGRAGIVGKTYKLTFLEGV
ncbi:helix-turn-helix domain-containing protein [Escherichia coli]|uniref:helix-turn-helix domain-containing protein n=1 Tax=Escherichia coli TaxID=562 RepID=UPI0035290D7B